MGLVLVIVQSSVLPSRAVWSSRVGSKVRPSMVNLIPPGPMPMAKVSWRRAVGGPCGVGGAGSDAGRDAGGADDQVGPVAGGQHDKVAVGGGGQEVAVKGDLGEVVPVQA